MLEELIRVNGGNNCGRPCDHPDCPNNPNNPKDIVYVMVEMNSALVEI